ncbi:MFS transporter [Pseudonocardia sp. CA-107938]|uniref:MFS transporter n=1 Tax=Pseudonocardia sp. CA-107938 TaxID=3240021 RepID=UPI003D941FF5
MILCFAVIMCDGFDLIVYGAAVPAILADTSLGVTALEAGTVGSYALAGMLIGALLSGQLTDTLGRRKILLISVTWFSTAMLACALAPNFELFGAFRFLAGLGMGAAMPTAIALTAEYSPADRRSINNALMFGGYSVGGILAAVLALALVPSFGFRSVFFVGAAPLLLIVPFLVRYLPESIGFLMAKGRTEEAEKLAARLQVPVAAVATDVTTDRRKAFRALFTPLHILPAILFAVVSFFGLLLVYGINTWLPQIMKAAGFSLSSSLLFLVVLNVGAAVGSIATAPLGDRFGMKPITLIAFASAAVSIFLLSLPMPEVLRYVVVAIAGFGTIGTQIIVNAYVAIHFPVAVRASALGWTLGIGRLGAIVGPVFGGLLLANNVGTSWNFYAFAIPAVIGLVLVTALPKHVGSSRRTTSTTAEPAARPA